MLRTLLFATISLFSLNTLSNTYVCTFDYYEKIARFEKDAVTERHLFLIPRDDCSKEKASHAHITIGQFAITALCDGKLNFTISQGKRALWNTLVALEDFSKPLDKSLMLSHSGLRFSCVERQIGTTYKIASKKPLDFY